MRKKFKEIETVPKKLISEDVPDISNFFENYEEMLTKYEKIKLVLFKLKRFFNIL